MRYGYRAIDAQGKKTRGQREAANIAELELRLREQGLDLINATEKASSRWRFSFGKHGASRQKWLHFWFQLEELLTAGIPLQEALQGIAEMEDATIRPAVEALADGIYQGQTLSGAMAEEGSFHPVAVCLIRAGETAGRLPEAIKSLHVELEQEEKLSGRARQVLAYPCFVAAVIAAVLFFLFYHLVPQLKPFLANMGGELPWHTHLLFACADLFRACGFLPPLLFVVALLVLYAALSSSPDMRLRFDGLLLRLPLLGAIFRKTALARFAGAFAMLYASGVNVLAALEATRDISSNRAIRCALAEAEMSIRAGRGISLAFSEAGMFPPFVVRMLAIGETSGALDRSLGNVCRFYRREVEETTARAERLIEPTLTLLLGLLLGWMILAVFAPIYDVIAHVGL